MTKKRSCAVGVCSSPEHCDKIAGCFSDPTAAVMRKALFFAKQVLGSGGTTVTKSNYITRIGVAIEIMADALDPERTKPFSGEILDLLELAAKDVLELRQQLEAKDAEIVILSSRVGRLQATGARRFAELCRLDKNISELRQQLAKLTMQCEKLVKWKHLMSYNDSYFGEPAGDLKRIVYEIELSMPIRGNK